MNSALIKSLSKNCCELMHRCLETLAIRNPELCHNQMTCESGASASFLCDGSFSSEVKTTSAFLEPVVRQKATSPLLSGAAGGAMPRLNASVSAKWVGGWEGKAFFACPDV